MAATGEVVRAREAQVEGAVADVEALKVAGTVAVGLARAVARRWRWRWLGEWWSASQHLGPGLSLV